VTGGDARPARFRATMWLMARDDALSDGERLVLRLHPHWKVLFRPVMILVLILIAALAVLIFLPNFKGVALARIAIGAVALLAAMLFFTIPLLRWWATTYELTTRRLRLRTGVLTRSGRDFPLTRINDVSFSSGLLDRLFGSGSLVVESAGEHGQLVLTEIPHVERVQSALFQLVADEQVRVARARDADPPPAHRPRPGLPE
jgi:uncharacterized membrane protein YdbT with pleckstrin-like domain